MPGSWDAPPKLRVVRSLASFFWFTRSEGASANVIFVQEPAVLDLSEDPFEALDHTITFLYTSDYAVAPLPLPANLDVRALLKTHISIFSLARKYQIPALQQLSAAKFTFVMNTELTSISIFFDLVTVIYSNEDDKGKENVLKEAVTEAAIREMGKLLGEGTRLKFLGLVSKHWEFLQDVLEMMKVQADGGLATEVEACVPFCQNCRTDEEGVNQVSVECRGCGLIQNLSLEKVETGWRLFCLLDVDFVKTFVLQVKHC
jgi:hypothetical protein